DYVIATGKAHSVSDFIEQAFAHAGLDWKRYIVQDPKFIRPAEVDHLLGDSSKARRVLGWKPSVDFGELVDMMVDADLKKLSD
ncbi:MAG: GDP-mannose 4,6-dehydratase, partial [Kiritimatiellota bacterium]|nr:GDP-mannose 4,6-dehydratase [Kiritimatiellota bacterium]